MEDDQQFHVLSDSGCSATLINKKFVKHWKKSALKPIKWSATKAGSFKNKRKCDKEFTRPACQENRKISCTAYVNESHQKSCNYHMIIG